MKKALAISGGGAWGAWGGGVIQALYEEKNKEYDLFIGSSTGSLLSPLASLKKMDKLKEAYTTTTQKDIFDVNPFNKKGKINFFNAIWRVIRGKKTLGESHNLRCLIQDFFAYEDFKETINKNKEIIACVVNVNEEKEEYKSSFDNNYNDFVDWVWASACAPIFMTLVEKNGCEYTDGGIIEHVPVQKAINEDCDEVDVIVHRPFKYYMNKEYKTNNILDLFGRVTNIMHKEISKSDILISKLNAKDKDVKINVYYTPYKLSDNSLMFDKEKMEKWWDLGYEQVEESKKEYKLSKDNILYEEK